MKRKLVHTAYQHERAEGPLPAVLSSATAERLTESEIAVLVNNPPREET